MLFFFALMQIARSSEKKYKTHKPPELLPNEANTIAALRFLHHIYDLGRHKEQKWHADRERCFSFSLVQARLYDV